MSGPLAGIRVIEVAIAVLGPLAAQILGDMGAEVIKVETPPAIPAWPPISSTSTATRKASSSI